LGATGGSAGSGDSDSRGSEAGGEDLAATFSPALLAAGLGKWPLRQTAAASAASIAAPGGSRDGFECPPADHFVDPLLNSELLLSELPSDATLFLDSSGGSDWLRDTAGNSDCSGADSSGSGYSKSRRLARGGPSSSGAHERRLVRHDTYGQWMAAQCADGGGEAPKQLSRSPFDLLRRRALADLDAWLAEAAAAPSEGRATTTTAAAAVDGPRDAYGNTLFLAACQSGAKRGVQWCLLRGADVNAANRFGNTGARRK
jgi:hypothetical protein